MRILDRYLTKNFLFPLIYCLTVFCLLYVIVDIFGHLDEILRNKVPINMLAQYYLSFIPLIFVQSVPIASLLAIVYMLSTLNKNHELTAAKACGVSVARLMIPIFVIGLLISLSIFLINERVVPRTVNTAEKIKDEYIEKSPENRKDLKIINNLTAYGKKNQIIYAKEFNPIDSTLKDIIILENDQQQRLRKKTLASNGIWKNNEWLFFNCIIYRFDRSGNPLGNPLIFEDKVIDLPETPQELLRYETQPAYMTYKELRNYINRLSTGGDKKTVQGLKTELYFKMAVPFVCMIIMLLGMPFALTTRRGGAMAGIGVSVVVGLLYYGSIYFSLALGKGGLLPPFVAAHISSVVFLFIALALIKRAPR